MGKGKRIVFSTATPNDQGGIIPNESIDLTRYSKNPVVLCQHNWNEPPLGIMTDIKLEAGKYSGVPVFHKLTQASKEYAAMYEAGHLRACSIGGEAEWKQNASGQTELDAEGLKMCNKFNLYEVSMVSLPSNPDAVTDEELSAKVYEKNILTAVCDKITNLSSQYKIPSMEPVTKTQAELDVEAAEKALLKAKEKADKEKLGSSNDPSASQLPGILKDLTGLAGFMQSMKNLFGNKHTEAHVDLTTVDNNGKKIVKNATAPAAQDEPESTITDPTYEQPTPIGLAAAKAKAEECHQAAQLAVEAAMKAKEKADKPDASDDDKADYAAKFKAAEEAMSAATAAADAYAKKKKEEEDAEGDDDAEMAANANGKKTTLNAPKKQPKTVIKLKTMAELNAERAKLAPPAQHKAKVISLGSGVTFSKLTAKWMDPKDDSEETKLLGRVITDNDGNEKDISEYAVVLNSIINDGKFAAVIEKLRVIPNINSGQLQAFQRQSLSEAQHRPGFDIKKLAADLNSGSVEVLGRDNVMRRMTTLTSTDAALASPALNTIEWLPLAIFQLFPSTSWKADIPMFGATMTAANTGIIWANIAAAPTIYKGTQPVSPTPYQYSDTAVSLALIPYWLQPMLWTPLTMHQLRYDQMATGWAQAFALWGATMDDELIYTLASTVPAGSIINTIGQPANPQFTLSGVNDPNSFYYNPTLTGSFATPAYNDITRIEQLYNKQNFSLEKEKVVLVVDPTMDAFIGLDPDTKSLLTRWIQSNPTDLLKIKHTAIVPRSRVAIYDPVSGQVKDPEGSIPATSVSAGLGFLPSQAGIGLGMLDVFMVQSPGSYGYEMSADIRIGVAPLRANYNGISLYTYGTPAVV